MCRFKGECEHYSFNKCPIYTHDGASAKFSTNSQEMDNSVVVQYFVAVSVQLLRVAVLVLCNTCIGFTTVFLRDNNTLIESTITKESIPALQ
jgi:hypothetical protein